MMRPPESLPPLGAGHAEMLMMATVMQLLTQSQPRDLRTLVRIKDVTSVVQEEVASMFDRIMVRIQPGCECPRCIDQRKQMTLPF